MYGYINGFDFGEMEAMKYYAPPSSWSNQKKKDHAHSCIFSGDWFGAEKKDGYFAKLIKDEDGNIIEGGYRIINTEEMHYEVNDNDYIIIDKKRKLAFAIDNTIQAHSVAYNRDEDVFIYANNNDWDVLLNIEQLIIFYQISRLSNDNAPKLSEQGFNIIFKTLKYL